MPYLRAEIALREVDLPRALAFAWESLKRSALVAEPWALAGWVLHESGDSALGAAFLRRAIALRPGFESAQRLLAQTEACPRQGMSHPALAAWARERIDGVR